MYLIKDETCEVILVYYFILFWIKSLLNLTFLICQDVKSSLPDCAPRGLGDGLEHTISSIHTFPLKIDGCCVPREVTYLVVKLSIYSVIQLSETLRVKQWKKKEIYIFC